MLFEIDPTFDVVPLMREAMAQEMLFSVEQDLGTTLGAPTNLGMAISPPLCPPSLGRSSNAHRHQKRREKRAAAKPYPALKRTLALHVQPATPIVTTLHSETLPAAWGAYSAKVMLRPDDADHAYGLTELLAMGFRLVPWSGR